MLNIQNCVHFFYKMCISIQSSACFEPRLLEDLALKCARCFYSLSLKNLLGMMVLYWIHQLVYSSRGEHTTRQCPILNNLPKIYAGADVCFSQKGDTISSLSYLVADSFSAFLGEQSLASKYDNPPILYETPFAKVKLVIQRVKHVHSL